MQNLKQLEVQSCNSLEVVFDFEGLNIEEVRAVVILDHLENLKVEYLPKLTHIWKKYPRAIRGFENIKSIKVSWCGSLKYLFSLSIVKLLVKLEVVKISNCMVLEEVVANNGGEDKVAGDILVLPGVRHLLLEALPNLTSFCPKMKTIASASPSTQNLYTVNSGFEETQHHRLFSKQDPTQSVCLGNLQTVEVHKCDSLGSLFPQSMATTLGQLETLELRDCKMMEEIVWKERGEDQETNEIEFPKLKTLEIESLPSLTGFCKGIDEIRFPQLEKLLLIDLPEFRSFCPTMSSSASEGNHNTAWQSLFNQKVAFPSLMKLELRRLSNINEIWCSQLPKDQQGALFINMVSLSVFSCETLRNIFSPSMARGLVNLQKLYIEDCLMMAEVVAKEGDEEEQDQETILFPQLNHLQLKNLPKLRSFCHVTFALEWPLLENVAVYDCPALKTFSFGSLSTSKLKGVAVQEPIWSPRPAELVWMGNLNDTIRHLYKEKVEGDDEEE